jgi:hypothetical protein
VTPVCIFSHRRRHLECPTVTTLAKPGVTILAHAIG